MRLMNSGPLLKRKSNDFFFFWEYAEPVTLLRVDSEDAAISSLQNKQRSECGPPTGNMTASQTPHSSDGDKDGTARKKRI